MRLIRELTVQELVGRLAEMPGHYPVTIMVNGTLGVITDVWCQQVVGEGSTPLVIVGERENADSIVPPEWTAGGAE